MKYRKLIIIMEIIVKCLYKLSSSYNGNWDWEFPSIGETIKAWCNVSTCLAMASPVFPVIFKQELWDIKWACPQLPADFQQPKLGEAVKKLQVPGRLQTRSKWLLPGGKGMHGWLGWHDARVAAWGGNCCIGIYARVWEIEGLVITTVHSFSTAELSVIWVNFPLISSLPLSVLMWGVAS